MNEETKPTTPTLTTIVRFECGCIGTEPDTEGHSAILNACDSDGGPGAIDRNMSGKTFKPVDYRTELWQAADDAYNYRALRNVLRHTKEWEEWVDAAVSFAFPKPLRRTSELQRRLYALRKAGIDTTMMDPLDIMDLPMVEDGVVKIIPNENWAAHYANNEAVRKAYDWIKEK